MLCTVYLPGLRVDSGLSELLEYGLYHSCFYPAFLAMYIGIGMNCLVGLMEE